MKAFIIVGNHTSDLSPLDRDFAGCMSPLLDRPWLQHFVEVLVNKGIKNFHFFISDHPHQIESYLEDGVRWGVKFFYHLGADEASIFRQIRIQSSLMENENILLCQGNCLFFSTPDLIESPQKICVKIAPENEMPAGNSWYILSAKVLSQYPADYLYKDLEKYANEKIPETKQQSYLAKEFILLNSLKDLLDIQNKILKNNYSELMCNASEIEPEIRISRNVVLSPKAKIIPPVFIGENCQISEKVTLGPNASISANCFVDTNSTITNSSIFPGSYVGEALNVGNSIINHNQLINLDIGGEISLAEDFLLGSMSEKWFFNYLENIAWRVVAATMLVVFSPLLFSISIFLLIINGRKKFVRKKVFIKAPSKSINAINTFSFFSFSENLSGSRRRPYHPLAHFFLDFLPGLISVIKGEITLVGLPMKTKQEFKTLTKSRKKLLLLRECGLINESQVFWQSFGSPEELKVAETYYMAKKSFRYDLSLLIKYFISMLTLPR